MAEVPADGLVDGDGHVLEPASLWDDYLEERFARIGFFDDPGASDDDPSAADGQTVAWIIPGVVDDPAKLEAAMRECKPLLPNGGEAKKPDTSQLEQLRRSQLLVQLGGASGTLSVLDARGVELARLLAHELGLLEGTA